MQSAELERTTVDVAAAVGPRRLDLRATGQVVKFDGFLTLYREGRDDPEPSAAGQAGEDDEEGRLPPMSAGDPLERRRIAVDAAFHRAAAALHGGKPGQAHGGARHRPALHLRGRARRLARARIRAHRQETARSGRQGPPRHRVPRKLFPPLRRIRFHGRSRGEARRDRQPRDRLETGPARFLAGLFRRHRRHQGAAHDRGSRCAERDPRPAYLSAAQRRREPAHLPDLRHRPALAQARPLRRLRRLLELSRMPLHAPVHGLGRRRETARRPAPASSATTPRPACR